MLDFIPDGYTRTVGFHESAGRHNAFSFTYRPFAGPDLTEVFTSILIERDAAKSRAAMLSTINDRIQEWSFAEEKTPEALSRLNPHIFDKIQGCVFGKLDPDWDAANGGKSDESLMEGDAGNSQAA